MCSAETICNSKTSDELIYKVDKSYDYYFNNWYVEMDLMCKTPMQIGFMVSVYFIGYSIGASLSFLPDTIGRKKSVVISLSISILCETVMLWVPDYNVRCVCFFITGLFQLQNSTSYQWLSESVASSYKSTIITIMNSVYALP